MQLPLDISYIDTAIVLALGGIMVHWIKKVNGVFEKLENLRFEHEKKLIAFNAELNAHIEISESVWEEVGRRLSNLERSNHHPRGN